MLSLAKLTHRLLAEQRLRALATTTLREMLVLAERNFHRDGSIEALDLIRTELARR